MSWRVCKTCRAICNGKHDAMLAVGDLAEQKCPWFNAMGGLRCVLAAPHNCQHMNMEAPVGRQRWLDGVDAWGRLERWKGSWRRVRRGKKVVLPQAVA